MSNRVIAGKYEVIREIGQGSYGSVFLVRHADLGVNYALKILKKTAHKDETFLERFRREAGIVLRFAHPGSVQLRDFGRTEEGLYYMAIDFCEGDVLEDMLANDGRLSLFDSLEIIIQVLDVLEAAHGMGIVHRDIKAGNIIIQRGPDGSPIARVLDFGMAMMRMDAPGGESRMTMDGAAVGTPDYMSPEQASGEDDVDHRADIYACGCLLYEMLTGTVPFTGQTVMQILLKHLTQPVPPFAEEFKIPATVSHIVFKALERERSRRYQSSAEFKADCKAAYEQTRKELSNTEQIEAAVPEAEPAPHAVEENTEALPKKKLLCLDDNEMILQIVRHIFEKEGYEVFTESSFSRIHDHVFKEKVRLMLCDVNMPGLPGTKICRMLKQASRKLKIILFSNIDERDLEKLAVECKADGWISKNSRPDKWLEQVRQIEPEIQ